MTQGDDQVGPALLQPGHFRASGLDDIDRDQPSSYMLLIPPRDLRRGDADHPDLQQPPRPVVVDE